jgi:acetyl-CoA carboxylase alpha subunit
MWDYRKSTIGYQSPRSKQDHAVHSIMQPRVGVLSSATYFSLTSVGSLRNIPIVFLHNVSGFMVGLQTEQAGLIKLGAQLISALSTSTVPHISIICGASYGAGNYAMW